MPEYRFHQKTINPRKLKIERNIPRGFEIILPTQAIEDILDLFFRAKAVFEDISPQSSHLEQTIEPPTGTRQSFADSLGRGNKQFRRKS